MLRGISTALAGLGVTFASTFTSSLGLSVHQERIAFAAGIALTLVGIGLFLWDWHRKRAPAKTASHHEGPSVAERRKQLDDRLFPRRNDRRELAGRSERLAAAIERWYRRNEGESGKAVNKLADEISAADPELSTAEARREGEHLFENNLRADYALRFRQEAKEVFDAAYEQGEIAKESERQALAPFAIELDEAPTLFRTIASRLDDEVASPPLAS
jgi:hypothetical protein